MSYGKAGADSYRLGPVQFSSSTAAQGPLSLSPPMLEQRKSPALLGQLQALGQARDGMIVSIALVYLIGFVSWAIHSWRFQIGFTSILDSQYFAAGVLPSVSLLISYGTWQLIQRRDFFSFFPLLGLAVVAAFVLAWLGGSPPSLNLFGSPTELTQSELIKASFYYGSLLILIPGYIMLLSLYLPGGAPGVAAGESAPGFGLSWVTYWFRRHINLVGMAMFGLGLVWCIGYTFALYILVLYPNLPQEIGGARPRCAELMFDPKKVPTPLLDKLGIKRHYGWSGGPDDSVVLPRARVLYNGDKMLVFRTADSSAQAVSIEVSKDIVLGIVDCKE